MCKTFFFAKNSDLSLFLRFLRSLSWCPSLTYAKKKHTYQNFTGEYENVQIFLPDTYLRYLSLNISPEFFWPIPTSKYQKILKNHHSFLSPNKESLNNSVYNKLIIFSLYFRPPFQFMMILRWLGRLFFP